MTRPKGKKGRTPKMPEIEWGLTFIEYGQEANACNHALRENMHADDCDGNCGKAVLKDSEVDMHNEVVHWNKLNWKIQGIPDVLMGGPFQGIGIDVLREHFLVLALEKAIVDAGIISEENLEDLKRTIQVEILSTIRKEAEAEQAKEKITVAKSKIILPGGNGEIKH